VLNFLILRVVLHAVCIRTMQAGRAAGSAVGAKGKRVTQLGVCSAPVNCISGSAAVGNSMTKPGLSETKPGFRREDAKKFQWEQERRQVRPLHPCYRNYFRSTVRRSPVAVVIKYSKQGIKAMEVQTDPSNDGMTVRSMSVQYGEKLQSRLLRSVIHFYCSAIIKTCVN